MEDARTACAGDWPAIPLIGTANGDGPGLDDTPIARAIDADMARRWRLALEAEDGRG